MRTTLPDPDVSLHDAADFVLDSRLARKALLCPVTGLPVFLRDVVTTIFRLTQSCHLPEFTDHGLPHITSLVDRLSNWTFCNSSGTESALTDVLDDSGEGDGVDGGREACILLLAILFHDMGMLSQRPEDMPVVQRQGQPKDLSEVPFWVRSTHVLRLPSLVRRLFEAPYQGLLTSPILLRALNVGCSHDKWPWHTEFAKLSIRDRSLASILAIADLLDEDAARCDTATLLNHRQGSYLNMAHWVRHALTAERVKVERSSIRVVLARLPGTGAGLDPVYAALRNHYRLVLLYKDSLAPLGAAPLSLDLVPPNGPPTSDAPSLRGWKPPPEFGTEAALRFHLLNTFMPLALSDDRRASAGELTRTAPIGLEPVNLTQYWEIRGQCELRSPDEQAFLALQKI